MAENRTELSKAFIGALLASFEKHGAETIARVAKESPAELPRAGRRPAQGFAAPIALSSATISSASNVSTSFMMRAP